MRRFLQSLDPAQNLNARLKALIRPMGSEQPFQTSFHSITENSSIHLNDLCADTLMNETYVLYVCLTNAIGDGPLSYARYFHIQSPTPVDVGVTSLSATVLSSREIDVKWNVSRVTPLIGYRIRWMAETNTNGQQEVFIASSNDSSVVLNNLVPYTVYNVTLNVFNVNGNGPTYAADLVRTDEDGTRIAKSINRLSPFLSSS